ncbi:hypothetical protein PanWU01x14_125170 [Parasponia andersonii]|uniref:RING-type E3 ubiquitin transferase n=1 Tax=Parasponia andersonii TaxID=3476 RepID=A0A2P5CTR3_PARAD|nr:hypothetical protein PanWU01x14_125170 [Parasponia andersonii]
MTSHANLRNGLAPFPPLMPRPQPLPLPPYVSAKRVETTVNVHKNTIKLNEDANDSNSLLVSFTFDALVDGSITIFYYAKEGRDCKFSPLYRIITCRRESAFRKV